MPISGYDQMGRPIYGSNKVGGKRTSPFEAVTNGSGKKTMPSSGQRAAQSVSPKRNDASPTFINKSDAILAASAVSRPDPTKNTSVRRFTSGVSDAGKSGDYGTGRQAPGATTGNGVPSAGAPSPGLGGVPTGMPMSASGVNPVYDQQAFSDPSVILGAMMANGSLGNMNAGQFSMANEFADNLSPLYMLFNGLTTNGYGNWAQGLQSEYMSPGGNWFSVGDIANALFNPNDAASQYFSNPGLSPQDQITNFMSAFRYGMESVMPAPMIGAVMGQLQALAAQYANAAASMKTDQTFADYVAANSNIDEMLGSAPASVGMAGGRGRR